MRKTLVIGLCLIISMITWHSHRLEAQTTSYPNWTRALAWSPTGSYIATATMNGTIQLWDSSGHLISTLQNSGEIPLAFAWSPDGTKLANSEGFKVKVWDVNTLQTIQLLTGHQDFVGQISWSPNGSYLIGVSFDYSPNIIVWDTNTWQPIFTTISGAAMAVTWSPNNQYVAISGFNRIEIRTVGTWEISKQLSTEQEYSYALAWSPDGTKIASAEGYAPQSDRVMIWDIATEQVVREYTGHSDIINDVSWSPDGTRIASASADGTVHVWDVNTGQALKIAQGSDTLFAVDWSPDGTKIAYGDLNGVLVIIRAPIACTPAQTVAANNVTGLINAINTANNTSGADTICLTQDSTYTFSLVHSGMNALPKITSDITIVGNGATLARQLNAAAFRFFEVSSNGTLTLENLTLTGAEANADPGGAILNTGNLTVNNVTFSGNHAGTGAAIDNHRFGGTSHPITATIINSTFENNTATYGAALDNDANATMTVSGSTFTGNVAVHDGGVIDNDSTATFTDSIFTANAAGRYGGAFETNGNLTLNGGTFSNNTAAQGGAVRNTSVLNVTGTTFENNTGATGGGYEGWGGAIFNISTGNSSVIGAVFSQNSAINGGAIRNHGVLSLTDSQILNNTASAGGSGIFSTGSTTAHNSCISGNTTTVTSVVHVGSNVQDFAGNYWGAPDGASGAGGGSGDSVNHNINFADFLTSCPY